MAKNEIRKSDIGVAFRLTIKDQDGTAVDISGATTKSIYFTKPDKTVDTQTATFPSGGSGTNGEMEYATISGDLDTTGTWKWQGYVVMSDGSAYRTDIEEFLVLDNLA